MQSDTMADNKIWAFFVKQNAYSLCLDVQGTWFYSHNDFGNVQVKLDTKQDAELIAKILTTTLLALGRSNLGMTQP